MQLSEIVPSRQYSWVYQAELKLLKGGRKVKRFEEVSGLLVEKVIELPINPLYGRVTVRKVKIGQAATSEMVTRKSLSLNPAYEPSEDYTPRWESTGHPCVVRGLSNGELAVRLLSPKTTKSEIFVDGRPITPAEIKAMQSYVPARKPADPTKVRVNFVYLSNLSNVENNVDLDDTPEED